MEVEESRLLMVGMGPLISGRMFEFVTEMVFWLEREGREGREEREEREEREGRV